MMAPVPTAPRVAGLFVPRVPLLMFKLPVKELPALVNSQAPASVLVTVKIPPLSARSEVTWLASVLTPRRVKVLAPAPVLVRAVRTSGPLPADSIEPPPVVPERLIGRVVVSPGPTYIRVPVMVLRPRLRAPPPTFVPKLLAVAPEAPIEETIVVPPVRKVPPL